MNTGTHLLLVFVLVFGHVVDASHEPTAFVSNRVINRIIDVITGGIKASPHIVGGYSVESHSHPHQVALFTVLEDGEESFCGGSLITQEWVLTAAHCLEKVRRNKIHAILGARNFSSFETDRQEIRVEKIITHQDWNDHLIINDIALLQLASRAILGKNVQTIRLPSIAFMYKDLSGTPVVMTGWGKLSAGADSYSPVLRSTESIVISNLDCNLKCEEKLKSTLLCVDGSKRKGVCNGDSGGPLITTESDGQKTLIGITSFTTKSGCEIGLPSVFTRVDQYLGWIAHNTGVRLREK